MRTRELVCVTADNHNKFYRQVENTNGTWTAFWGRVGVTESTKVYPMKDWDKKYNEKLKKGYKDITAFKATLTSVGFKDITDKQLQELLNTLQKYSKQSIVDNYTVTVENVTQTQVDEAQAILTGIIKLLTPKTFNRYVIDQALTQLYTVLPRKMKHVKLHILNGDGDLQKAKEIVSHEQELIDNMASQVKLAQNNAGEQITLEQALGIKLAHVTNEEALQIKKLLGANEKQYKKAYRVVNLKTQAKFEERKKKSYKEWSKLLWHGSRNENWLSIISKGLAIRPTGVVTTGAMFGLGIYYANKAQKSIGYSSLKGSYWANGVDTRGFLALYEVNTGNEYRVNKHEPWMYKLDENTLRSKGDYDSLFCAGGYDLRNDEYIIYNDAQCTIKYLVEIAG